MRLRFRLTVVRKLYRRTVYISTFHLLSLRLRLSCSRLIGREVARKYESVRRSGASWEWMRR